MVHIGGCNVMLQLAARWPVAAGFGGQGLVVKPGSKRRSRRLPKNNKQI